MREPISLESTIKEIEDQILDIKAARQFAGRDSILTYRTSSNNQYDIASTPPIGETRRFRLTLDYSKASDGSVLELNMFYRLDNPDVMAAPMPRINATNPHVEVFWEVESLDDTSTSWIVSIVNVSFSLTPTAYAKYFIDGTDTGTVTIEAL